MPREIIGSLPPQEGKERLVHANVAFVFPGQGTQEVGMGLDLYQQSPAAKAIFDEADEALGFKLSRIIFEGPDQDLRKTINTQPGLLATSTAFYRAFKEHYGDETPIPKLVAGHSIGTLSALVVAGVITFRDGVKLARERGRLMEQASKENPGSMAAIIGLDELALDHICAEMGVDIGSFNSADQVTITGERRAVAQAVDLAILRGANQKVTKILPVSGAFHSKFMDQIRIGLRETLADITFANPQVPIIANSTAEILTDPDKIKEELINGGCIPVRWKQSVDVMTNSGVTSVFEFGPGRVLSALVKRTNRAIETNPFNNLESIRKFAS